MGKWASKGVVWITLMMMWWGVSCTETAVLPTPAVVANIPAWPVPLLPTNTPLPGSPTPLPTVTATLITTLVPTETAVPTHTPIPSPTPCQSTGTIETGSLFSQIAGTFAYRVYLPPCYGQDGRSYPTLYMLPGNIYDNTIWDTLGLDETAESLIQRHKIPPFLIVMTDGGWIANDTSGGPGSYESVIVQEVIPTIEATYCAWNNPDGRAIGGMSRGGYWSLEIAFQHPTLFASVGGHSAALIDSYAGPAINPRYTGLSRDLGDLRVYLDAGRRDPYITHVRQLHEDMAAANIPHTWVMNEGTHEETYWVEHLTAYLTWYSTPWSPDRNSYPPCQTS